MTWEISELTYERTGEHRGWMLINTETKRTIACESEEEARAIADTLLGQTFGAESTYEYVMGMIEDLSDDDYMDFCYEMDIDPEDMEELSSFVMRNYNSNRVMKFLKEAKGIREVMK